MRHSMIVGVLVPLLAACSDSTGVVQLPPTDSGADLGATDGRLADTAPGDTTPPDSALQDTSPDTTALEAAMDSPGDSPGDGTDTAEVAFRCTMDRDCVGRPEGGVCDDTSGRCVGCVPTRDTCPARQYCEPSTGACAPGCADDRGCAEDAGVGGARCDPRTHACVECVTDAHCPAGRLCVGSTCVAGCTATRACPSGQSCCGGACVDPLSNTAHCGACDNRCAVPNGTAACMNGTCAVGACTAPFGDCDVMARNGCETDTRTSVAHCGGCGRACMPPNATGTCVDGACTARCDEGFGDCDRNVTNGCEADTRASATHCGGCGRACAPVPGAAVACMGSVCARTCNRGVDDCDGVAANGCEADLTSSAHCGRCGNACAAGLTCSAGACTPLASCAAIHRAFPALASGEYPVDPDGAGPAAPFAVFCEMTLEGGGWTLLGTAHNHPPAGSPARRWDTEAALAGPDPFGDLAARTTDNFKSPAWSAVAGADLLVLTDSYHFGFRGLLGDRTFRAFVTGHPEWTRDACSTTWVRSGVDFASEGVLPAARQSLGFALRGLDINGDTNGCFPGIAPSRAAGIYENAAFGFSAGPAWWVWGWGNTPAGQADWRPYDLSLFNLSTLNGHAGACTSDYPAGRWPCNALGRWMNGNAYDRSDKVRYGQLYVR